MLTNHQGYRIPTLIVCVIVGSFLEGQFTISRRCEICKGSLYVSGQVMLDPQWVLFSQANTIQTEQNGSIDIMKHLFILNKLFDWQDIEHEFHWLQVCL